jgi:hypothetical protein
VAQSGVVPSNGNIGIGSIAKMAVYNTPVAWTPFGSGVFTSFSSSSGDRVVIGFNALGVPVDYVSGNPLTATGTIVGESFASTGITPGSYVTVFSNGGFSDTVTFNAIPEPWGMALGMTAGVAGLFVTRRNRR